MKKITIEAINQLLNDALFEISKDKKRVDKAFQQFREQQKNLNNEVSTEVFNSWLLHNYSDQFGMAIDLANADSTLKETIKQHRLGFYDVVVKNEFLLFTDILTREQYAVNINQFDCVINDEALCFCRIYSYRGENIASDDYRFLNREYRKIIIENIFNRYHSVDSESYYTMNEFILKNPLLLHSAAEILDNITVDEDNYSCYELYCKIENAEAFDGFIKKHEIVETLLNDVFSWREQGIHRADIAVTGENVYFECNSDEDLAWVVDILSSDENGLIQIETKMTHLDDIFDS